MIDLEKGGVVLLNKPYEWTSFQAVNKVKYLLKHYYDLKKVKIGHAGTLDPLASGVLPIGIGNATRLFDYFLEKEKVNI